MAKLLKGVTCFVIVFLAIGLVAGPRITAAFLIAFVGLLVALRNGYFRTVSSERFRLYDYRGQRRAELAGAVPPPGHALGDDWDPSPGLDLYHRTGERAATLGVDWIGRESSVLLALFRDQGRSAVGMVNGPLGQGLFAKNAASGREHELRLTNRGELCLGDDGNSQSA